MIAIYLEIERHLFQYEKKAICETWHISSPCFILPINNCQIKHNHANVTVLELKGLFLCGRHLNESSHSWSLSNAKSCSTLHAAFVLLTVWDKRRLLLKTFLLWEWFRGADTSELWMTDTLKCQFFCLGYTVLQNDYLLSLYSMSWKCFTDFEIYSNVYNIFRISRKFVCR